MPLVFSEYSRKPFIVKAVQVTKENIREIAELLDGTLCYDDEHNPFLKVSRKKIPSSHQVVIGDWLTQLAENGKARTYSPEMFAEQFDEVFMGQIWAGDDLVDNTRVINKAELLGVSFVTEGGTGEILSVDNTMVIHPEAEDFKADI